MAGLLFLALAGGGLPFMISHRREGVGSLSRRGWMVRYADLPNPLMVPPREASPSESKSGRDASREIQVTYDNPDWTATNYPILVGMAIARLVIVLGLFAAAAWRHLKRERPQPLAQAA